MRKNLFNYLVDLVSLLLMLAMMATGLVMRYILPPGSGGRGGGSVLTLWGGARHDWGNLHFWASIGLLALLLVHLVLHWAWVCAVTRRLLQGPDAGSITSNSITRMLYGLTVAAGAVIGFGIFWVATRTAVHTEHRGPQVAGQRAFGQLMTAIEHQKNCASRPTRMNHEVHESKAGNQYVRGSMTLQEASRAASISPTRLRDRLGLPASVPLDERLGRLRRQYVFEMSTIRSAVEELKPKSSENDRRASDCAKKLP